jgi:hypothetical protein
MIVDVHKKNLNDAEQALDVRGGVYEQGSSNSLATWERRVCQRPGAPLKRAVPSPPSRIMLDAVIANCLRQPADCRPSATWGSWRPKSC